jgi:hypothetical protein
VLSAREQAQLLASALLAALDRPTVGVSIASVTPLIRVYDGDQRARVRLQVQLNEGELLVVSVTLDVAPGWPMWPHYSFHLQDSNRKCIVRYDNVPHHPEIASFPDHQHIGPSEAVADFSARGIRGVASPVGPPCRSPTATGVLTREEVSPEFEIPMDRA